MSSSKTTTDHDEIRKWVEDRGGKPASVKGTENKSDEVGILRIEFPESKQSDDDGLEAIEWDEFFDKFDESKLAFLYQEETSDGSESRFFKLVSRDN